MNDFNLRPEIMGFGRPGRILAAEAAPPKLLPADQWKSHGTNFEVNGLGQLRTALALPAPEAEIAASMRHADAGPIARRKPVFDEQAAFETWLHETCPSGDVESVQHQWAASSARADWADVNEWPAGHTETCHCEGCVQSSLGGRFSNPTKIMAGKPRLTTSQAASDIAGAAAAAPTTVGEALRSELQVMILKLVGQEGKGHVRQVLLGFNGANSLREVPFRRYAELKARLQAELDAPF